MFHTLKLPGEPEATILLYDRSEAGDLVADGRPMLFSGNIRKALDYLGKRSVAASRIQDGGGVEFFEIRDPEGNAIEICEEP